VTAPDDATFRLLHEVRLRGVVEFHETEIVALLINDGFVARSARGIRITTAGRVTHASWALLPAGGEGERVARRAYERFLPLNRELLQVCSDWQVRSGGIPNDHRDPRYDWSVVDRLHALDERIGPVASRLGRAIDRFAAYRPRLREALARDKTRTQVFDISELGLVEMTRKRIGEGLLESISTGQVYLDLTFLSLAMLVVGGVHSLLGAVVGGLGLSLVNIVLQNGENGVHVLGLKISLPQGSGLVGIALVIARDARRVAPAGDAQLSEARSARDTAARVRRRRAQAKAARRQRKRNR